MKKKTPAKVVIYLQKKISGQWNYDDMNAHFTSRIQKICKLDFGESFVVANAMLKACKEAFPCLNRDLRAQYERAMGKDNTNLENNNNILQNLAPGK